MEKISFVETPKEIAELMINLSTIPKNGLVLDTGCGKGIFLEVLREFGYKNCVGIEIDKDLYNHCKAKFDEFEIILGDYLSYNFKEKFDLIIGNPPYAHFNSLPEFIKKEVKRIIGTSEGDIYYAFIIKSINLLKDGGELIYIVPYHFFYNTYAKIVRDNILKHGKLEIIIDLDEVRLFKNENPETIIFKFKKGEFNHKSEKIDVIRIISKKVKLKEIKEKAINVLNAKKSNDIFEYMEIPHYTTPEPWSTFFTKIPDFPHVLLKDIAKVGVGLVSGFDEAFLLNEDDISKLNEDEKQLIKNFVKAKNCKRFVVEGFVQYILIEDNLKDEEIFKTKYPNIYKKLLKFKDRMENRYLPKNKKWFNWQALRNYKFLIKNLNKKRIYVPTLDRKPYNRFSLGDDELLPSGDVIFIQPYNDDDIYFLLGYLNSSFFRNYYLANGGRRGGRVAFTQKLLENAKIPTFSDEVKEKIKNIVKDIIYNLKNGKDIENLERQIDYIIVSAINNNQFKGYQTTLKNLLKPKLKG
ncbi:TPA: N-6 DNA methylase [Methanocaldococcus jannaschii]|uniref:site-specific DNA-methyltransferase (adenine-specific) n=1 Tax=Methanocaldococcus jannaschii TaxID=2190 RepID=A0A832WHX5_9EURY|nr:N-6 DNA methylase [Methanocaldococcus jannaschii]